MRADLRLPLVFAALILLVVSNIFPIAEVMVRGQVLKLTFLECFLLSGTAGPQPIPMIMLITTIVYPLLEMLSMALRLLRGRPSPAIVHCRLLRVLNRMRPCTMIQIYILGMLVTLSQVSLVASIVPGVALAAMGILIVLFGALLVSDTGDLWR